MSTNHRTIKWIENLAEQELSIRAGERASHDISLTKEEVLSVETVSFIRELFHHFEYMVRLFNLRVNQPTLQFKLLRNGERLDGFSIVRNGMKLVLNRTQTGLVQIQCDKLIAREGFAGTRSSVMFTGIVEARFGTFDDVEWHFLGNTVSAEQVARHYLTEFIQISRDQARLH